MFVNQTVFTEIRVAVLDLFMGTDKNSDREGRTDGQPEEAILIRFPYSC